MAHLEPISGWPGIFGCYEGSKCSTDIENERGAESKKAFMCPDILFLAGNMPLFELRGFYLNLVLCLQGFAPTSFFACLNAANRSSCAFRLNCAAFRKPRLAVRCRAVPHGSRAGVMWRCAFLKLIFSATDTLFCICPQLIGHRSRASPPAFKFSTPTHHPV